MLRGSFCNLRVFSAPPGPGRTPSTVGSVLLATALGCGSSPPPVEPSPPLNPKAWIGQTVSIVNDYQQCVGVNFNGTERPQLAWSDLNQRWAFFPPGERWQAQLDDLRDDSDPPIVGSDCDRTHESREQLANVLVGCGLSHTASQDARLVQVLDEDSTTSHAVFVRREHKQDVLWYAGCGPRGAQLVKLGQGDHIYATAIATSPDGLPHVAFTIEAPDPDRPRYRGLRTGDPHEVQLVLATPAVQSADWYWTTPASDPRIAVGIRACDAMLQARDDSRRLTPQVRCQALSKVDRVELVDQAQAQCRAGHAAACMVVGALGGTGIILEAQWSGSNSVSTGQSEGEKLLTLNSDWTSHQVLAEDGVDVATATEGFAKACALGQRRGCAQAASSILAMRPIRALTDPSVRDATLDCADGDGTACSLLMLGWQKAHRDWPKQLSEQTLSALRKACHDGLPLACDQAELL